MKFRNQICKTDFGMIFVCLKEVESSKNNVGVDLPGETGRVHL